MLESASYLRLSLVCARGTPVAIMLAHSPPLPLIIDHLDLNGNFTTKHEEGVVLALRHRDHLRCIRLMKAVPIFRKRIMVLDGEHPILEHLYITDQQYSRPMIDFRTELKFPENFRAPQICCLALTNCAIPITSPLLTTMRDLVTLDLSMITYSFTSSRMLCLNGFHLCLSSGYSVFLITPINLDLKWRGNCYTRQLRRASHFLTSVALDSKLLTHTWKRFFLGSPCLSSRGFESISSMSRPIRSRTSSN